MSARFADLPIRPRISHVVFDFDGTLSWLRHGWPEIMCGLFLEYMRPTPGQKEEELRSLLIGEIIALNGQPSVLQCARFAEIYADAGGPRLSAAELVTEFQRRLDGAIVRRMEGVRTGSVPAETYIIHAALPFLQEVSKRGLISIILSSTIQVRVREEAAMLGLATFFGRHIYGSFGEPGLFTKRAVFDRLLVEEGITGEHLLSFGDGPVELRETKALGGLAVAIASDENHNGSGIIDPHKEPHLLAAGADAVLPDFREATALLDHVLGR